MEASETKEIEVAASVMLSALLLAQKDMLAAGISDVCVEAAIAQACEAGISPARLA